MRKNNRTGKRLRLIPLILGSYGVFLGFGLVVIGLSEITEGIGIIRLLFGLGMAGFGLLGIWDGVRDLIRPDKKPEKAPISQFIFTDTSGNRSSNVTSELLRKQIDALTESEDYKSFYLQILPPLSVEEYGTLKQISCVQHHNIILVAFFETPKDGYRIYQKSTEADMAEEWLKQLLSGSPDFSGWENVEADAGQNEEDICCEEEDRCCEEEDSQWDEEDTAPEETDIEQDAQTFFLHQLQAERKGQMTYWHKLLIIFGESWHDEHKFFSSKDLELAIEGVHSGKYQKTVLEWGYEAFHIFPGQQNNLMVIWYKNNGTEKENPRFLAREGTVTQVKFWLVGYLEHGFLKETSGWSDITDQIEKETKKGGKKHGKVF